MCFPGAEIEGWGEVELRGLSACDGCAAGRMLRISVHKLVLTRQLLQQGLTHAYGPYSVRFVRPLAPSTSS